MVGLRYGFYPRVPDVISRTSEVRASERYHISHKWINHISKTTMRLFIYHIPSLFICLKIFECILIFLHLIFQIPGSNICKICKK